MHRGLGRPVTENTPHAICMKRHTLPNKITPRRDPIEEKLPREDNNFRRSPGLWNPSNRLQHILPSGTHSRNTLNKIRVGRLHRILTIRTVGPRPNIFPDNPRTPSRDHEKISQQTRFPNKKRSPLVKIPNPNPPPNDQDPPPSHPHGEIDEKAA